MEIEIKALLTKEKYEELQKLLPKKFKKVNEDVITTFRFKPKDVRIRYSDKINELVFKEGDPTKFSRKEVSINLKDRADAENMIAVLRELGFKDDPSWIKKKEEFVCNYNGFEYLLSLQFIENFAYLLEAEIMSDDEKHIPNLKQIISSLGCQPIEPAEFNAKIDGYIRKNSKK
ncbi:Uncharacterised protein [uncultured archaeon]|nr:Uncharacterised protein [uncultured archaeon]